MTDVSGPPAAQGDVEQQLREINEALLMSSVHQHGLTEAARQAVSLARDSEARFRALFESSPMAVFVCDTHAVIQQYNARAAELWGREPTCGKEQHCGSTKLWLPDGTPLPHEQSPMVEVLRTGIAAHNVEVLIERPDGSRLPVLVNFAALRDAKGEVTGAITSFIDITERKQAEATIRESEHRFRAIADNIPQLAWMADREGHLGWFNRGWLEYTGTTLDQNQGAGWKTFHHPDHVGVVTEKFERHLREGKDWEDTFPLRGKDGQYRWFLSRMKAIRDESGKVVRFFGTNTDVTEVRAAEEAVRISEIRYRRLFEAASDGILILDADTARVVEVNRYMLDLLRFPREHFLGKELWELGVFHDKHENQEAMRTLRREGAIRYEDLPLEDRDGRRVPVEFLSNIYVEDHEPIIQCNIRDISERKRFADEREAHLINEQLLRMEAETANRAKDMFLATLSHEMRTPLNAIVGWMSVLRSDKCDDADLQEGLEVIERQTKAQVQLIEDVLDVSRIVSGKLRLEMRPCELIETISAGVEVVRPAAEARDITLNLRLDPSASRATCDAARIQQVVWNLVSNAVKFTPKGGTVGVTLGREQSSLQIQVADSGEGIDPGLLPYVFDRFRQADSSSRRRFGGLGLGLSIVKHLVELHGGTVEAHSDGDGQGSTFTVRLPIKAVVIEETSSGSSQKGAVANNGNGDGEQSGVSGLPLVRLDGLRVLVVDDEADARRLLVKVLSQAGAIVTAAAGAAEALEALPTVKPAVLVSDLGMPDQDGFDLIRQVRGRGNHPKELPAVALTAFVHKDDARQALLAGFQVHVSKPVDPHDLTAVIASLAGRTGQSGAS